VLALVVCPRRVDTAAPLPSTRPGDGAMVVIESNYIRTPTA